METNWLDDVLTLLEERNLTRAAERRNVTQPAFSRRIRGFEDWLGRPILGRGPNRIEIDPALAANEAEIRALVSQISELRLRIVHHDPNATTLRIAAQHAALVSQLPDMADRARRAFPGLRLRVRAGNLDDCVNRLLRGDVEMLLCHEAANAAPLRFGSGVRRVQYGTDGLIPVVGGALRDAPHVDDLPAIVYPQESYFGAVLSRRERRYGTAAQAGSVVCETAFSAGIREMVLAGIGVAWLPSSMVRRDLARGALVSLADRFGSEPLETAVYADSGSDTVTALLSLWMGEDRTGGAP
ncbi:LysR family transcriptional regulator [Jannaschia seohaensis]|uniref:DNA-binding transcriptional LysR family regulator n=1 Tax=Jannaschia seohaensis TaxID=475081 RepID=A0A2Y9AKE2_9RHOB|nr:LysR substrate-binding domain-containing protein [Jannaschia seohaensis]PWJ20539.1 DNA-binding transcriptional LysR family regulator [Jannaschia seohaensis]SSA44635.1 DNA-binding transcriptional regulator, LysR family [Jannaschia seohaensis]